MVTTQPDAVVRDLNNAVEDLLDYLHDDFWPSAVLQMFNSLPASRREEIIALGSRVTTPPPEVKLNLRRWLAAALRQPELRTQICKQVQEESIQSYRKIQPAPTPVRFTFMVNPSFKDYRRHVITIPIRQVGQPLEVQLTGPCRVIAPDGTTFRGKIFGSATHGRPFWQLTIAGGHPEDVLTRMTVGTPLTVEIFRAEDRVQVRLLDPAAAGHVR